MSPELEMTARPVDASLPETAEILTDKPAAAAPATPAPAAVPEPVEKLEATKEPAAPSPGWRGNLSEDMRGHEFLAGFDDDVAGLQKYVEHSLETEQHVRQKGIIEPFWKDEDDVARFDRELGWPEEVSGYDLGDFEMPEGGDEGVKDALLGILHTAHVPQRYMAALLPAYMAVEAAMKESEAAGVAQVQKESLASLEKDWGRAFPGNTDLANRAMRSAAQKAGVDPESVLNLELKGGGVVGDHVDIVRMFHAFGSGMAEGALVGPKNSGIRPLNPETAKGKLDALMREHGKPGGALVDPLHHEHESVMREKTALFAAMHPENLER